MAERFVEISHRIRDGMVTYPGLPAPRVELLFDHEGSRARYGDQAEFLIASLHLCGNTGTYVDAPLHRYRHGADLAALPLDQLADVPITVVDCDLRSIGPEVLTGVEIADRAVLFRTGHAAHFGTPQYGDHGPYLTTAICQQLVDRGAAFVGIDAANVDDTRDPARPAHTILLGAGIPVCEHLTNLGALGASSGRLHAVPIAWIGGASFPVRAYVILDT
jgi:arylformamidase